MGSEKCIRDSNWAVDPNFAEKVGLKKENGKEVSQQQAAKQEQKAEQKQQESNKKNRGPHL